MLVGPRIIEGAYLDDLLDQPAALQRCWKQLALHKIPDLADRIARNEFRAIVLTGMGSSLYALYPLHLGLIAHGLSSQLVETSELLHFQAKLLHGPTLVIAVSQSGRSAEIVRVSQMPATEVTIVAVTNDEKSPLALRADYCVSIAAGHESSVSCKTYVATLLALEWLSAALTGGVARTLEDLSFASEAVHQYVSRWQDHVEELHDVLAEINILFVTGRGRSLAAAETGALILKESTRFPAEGMSCAAFRHGPMEAAGPHVLVTVFDGDEPAVQLNHALAADVLSGGGRSVVIETSAPKAVFRLPSVPHALRPIVEILPIQMISLALAARNGIEAGRFERASKITSSE